MNLSDVDTAVCGKCGGKLAVHLAPETSVHYAWAACSECGRFADWVRKPREDDEVGERDFSGPEEWFERDGEVVKETEKAIQVQVEDGSKYWVPKSQLRGEGITDESVIVTAWWAHKARWDRDEYPF